MVSKALRVFLPILVCWGLPSVLVAQEIEEIVVTAQKRTEAIQDVPISIQALTARDLEQYGINRAEEILDLFANLSSIKVSDTNHNFFIRGVGTSDFHLNTVGAVGVYLDEVSINSPFGTTFSLFDMERVEVMRGPQNTLYGRNTTGGAVNYISRKPDPTKGLNGHMEATYGRYDQIDLEGAMGIPLGDRAAARVSLISNTRDGTFNNLTLGTDVGTRERLAGRGQVIWDPTDNMSILLNAHGGVNRSDGRPWKVVGRLDPDEPWVFDTTAGVFVQNLCSVPQDQLLPKNQPNCADQSGFVHQFDDWQDVFGGQRHREEFDQWGVFARIDWQFPLLTLTSITSYDYTYVRRNHDFDSSPNLIFLFNQEGDAHDYSQEFRLASEAAQKFRWIAGFYYFFEDADYITAVRRSPPGRQPFLVGVPGTFTVIPNTNVQQDNELFSIYGQAEYDLLPELTATVGLRWTTEEKSGFNDASVRCGGGTGGPPFCPLIPQNTHMGFDEIEAAPVLVDIPVARLQTDENIWGGRFALDWGATEDLLLYASISRGFKSGGFSIAAQQALIGLAALPVEPEILWAYEAGFKSNWLNNRLQFNAAGFYYDWTDLQSFQVVADIATGAHFPQLVNVPEASLIGAEFEVSWLPAEGWYVQGGLGVLDSSIDDSGSIVGVAKGHKLPSSPDLTFNGRVRREFHVGPGKLALQTNFRYQDDITYDLANARNRSQESYWILNARATYTFGRNDRYQIAFWGENLTDTEFCTGAGSIDDAIGCLPSDGFVGYGVTASIRFE
jgi:iron complex outermembrane receptor protein